MDGQDVVRLTGAGSDFVEIPENQTLRYQNGQVTFFDKDVESPSPTTFPNSFKMLTVFQTGGDLEIFMGSGRDVCLPIDVMGFFYYDSDGRAFFTDSTVLEGLRPFPALFAEATMLPPPIRRYIIRGSPPSENLVLNIDDTGDPDEDPEDDRFTLTGSTETRLTKRQSFDYLSNILVLRDGPRIIGTFPGITDLTVLFSNVLRSVSGSVLENFVGPGTLYTNGGEAFYATFPEVQMEISEQVVENQFNFNTSTNPSSAIVQSSLGPSTGNDLIELVGATVILYPTARNISYSSGIITINDGRDNLLQEIGTLSNPVELSTFLMNEVQRFSGRGRDSLIVSPGGLIVYFNADTNQVFAYQARNTEMSKSIEQARENANVPVRQSVQFSIRSDGLGGAILSGQEQDQDGIELASVSDKTFDLGENDILRYSSNTVEVSRLNRLRAIYDGIDTFVANHVDDALDSFMGEAIQTYFGPGRLYIDPVGRAFYTANFDLVNRVNAFLSTLPGVTPRFECETVYGAKVAQIETPDSQEILVTLSSSTTRNVPSNQGVYFFDDQLNTVNTFKVPENSRAFYNADFNRVTVSDSSGNIIFMFDAFQFFAYLIPGGMTDLVTENTTLPSNGYIYFGNTSALYTINNDINGQIANTLFMIGAVRDTLSCPDHFSIYDGKRIQLFTDSASIVFQGDGIVYSSGCQSFYSTSTDFNLNIPAKVSELAPISATYDLSNNNVVVVNSMGDIIFTFPVGSSQTIEVAAQQSFMFVDGTIIGLTPKPITNVIELRYFNGFEVTSIFSGGEDIELIGPGVFSFNPETGVAFFTDDDITSSIIFQRTENVLDTFEAPVLAQPSPIDVTSKAREVNAMFGQSVRVFEGATVNLRCETSNCNPLNEYNFFVLFDSGNGTIIMEPIDQLAMNIFNITVVGNSATLRIDNIRMGTGIQRFQCVVSNPGGDDTIESVVEIRPVGKLLH